MPGRNTEAAPAVTRHRRDCVRNSTPDLPLEIMTQSIDVHACCVNSVSRPRVLLIWCYRITEWFGLEGTLKIIWFQLPCHGQGHLPLEQGAQSSIQPGLEHFQGGGI